MERPLTLNPMSIHDENSVVHRKKAAVDGKSNKSIPLAKKGGVARETRKALNDITNKSSIHPEAISQSKKSEKRHSKVVENGYSNQKVSEFEAQSKKKISVDEKLNIAEEGFLHDHSKCIDAQKETASEHHFWDTVLPGHELTALIIEQPKVDPNKRSLKLEEFSMEEFCDWSKSCWKSPPHSPLHQDCAPPSLSVWEFEEVEFVLTEDDDGDLRCIKLCR